VNVLRLRRVKLALAMVALAAFVGYFVNHLNINTSNWTWEQEYVVPALTPVGIDFRDGLYRPAETLLNGGNPYTDNGLWYPPFSVVLALPFQLLNENTAYLVQVWLLVGMNIATLWLALKVSAEVFAEPEGSEGITDHILTLPLFCALALWLVTSYGFLFSIERGNFDIYTQLAAVAGLWLMVKRPSWVWLQVVCFSVAAHLKVYPAILFVLVLWKHGWRSLLPLAVVNIALLLSLGPANAGHFLSSVTGAVQAPYLWQGNHSAASFGHMVNGYLGPRGLGSVPGAVFYIAPIGIWVFACIYLLRRGFSSAGAVWLFMLSVPMMNLIPATSHDSKLVLLGAPLAMVFFFVSLQYSWSGRRVRALQVAVVGGLMAVLALSYTRLPAVLGNKYPFILALQMGLLWVLLTRSSAKPSATALSGAV